MASTSYGVNAPEAVKLWSRRLATEVVKQTYIGKFIGQGDSALIQEITDTKKGEGDRVRVTLRLAPTGAGVIGDERLEGNEESLDTRTDDIIIDQLRHAARERGKMSQQRVPFSVREANMGMLRDWWADRLDTIFFNHICGYTPATDMRYAGNNAVLAPSATRHIFPTGETVDDGLDSTGDTFTLDLIDQAKELAETASPMIRPIKYQGENMYVMFLSPSQVRQMRTDTNAGEWADIQKAAMMGGMVKDNPIFTGALGVYNNVILHQSTRITPGVHSTTGESVANVRRAVLCGAQACGIAFGKGYSLSQMDWVEEMFDYENQLGVSAGMIFGLKKMRHSNLADFGTIVVSTYSPPISA